MTVSDLFIWTLSASAMASVLVLFILIAKWSLKDKLKPRWAYLLWMLLALRLLLPWAPESSFSVFNMFPEEKFQTLTENRQIVLENGISAPNIQLDVEIPTSSMQSIRTDSTQHIESAPTETKSVSIMQITSLVWLIGVIVFLTFIVATHVRFASKIIKGAAVCDSRVQCLFEDSKQEMNVRRSIALIRTNQVSVPTLVGALKPKLLMPDSTLHALSEEQLRFVFLHELAHVKRNDIAMNWVMTMLLALHWFNPLLWYAYHKMRDDQEMACDALALSRIRPEESKAYALTIITLLETFSSPLRLAGTASMSGNKKELKRRILMITSFTKNSSKWSLLGLAVILLISGCAMTNAKTNIDNNPYIDSASVPSFPIPREAKLLDQSEDGYEKYLYNAQGGSHGIRDDYYNIIGQWGWKEQTDLREGDAHVFEKGGTLVGMTVHGSSEDDFFTISKVKPEILSDAKNTAATPEQFVGAKNDPGEVAIALKKIREIAPYLYELKTEQNGVAPNLATYRPDSGVTLHYRVPETDDKETQGFLFIFEYPKEIAEKIMNSAFSPKFKSEIVTIDERKVARRVPDPNYKLPTASETFELNGIQWSYYGNNLLRGEKEGYYYEIQTQGKFTYDGLADILKHFNQHD